MLFSSDPSISTFDKDLNILMMTDDYCKRLELQKSKSVHHRNATNAEMDYASTLNKHGVNNHDGGYDKDSGEQLESQKLPFNRETASNHGI